MRIAVVYGVSIALHVGLAGGVLSMKRTPRRERVAVLVREVKRPAAKAVDEPPKPATPPPPAAPKAPPRRVAMSRPRPAPAAAPPAPSAAPPAPAAAGAAVPDFGLTLAGGAGAAGGLAVPAGGREPAKAEEPVRHARPKVLAARADEDDCADAAVKPKPIHVAQPSYTDDARAAQITGKVRVEITVGAGGDVTDVRVLQGLGHGLDEAALEAARASTFEPGSRCGKPVATTFTVGMRFAL